MKKWWRKRQLKSHIRILTEFKNQYILAWGYEPSEWVRKRHYDSVIWCQDEIKKAYRELDELR